MVNRHIYNASMGGVFGAIAGIIFFLGPLWLISGELYITSDGIFFFGGIAVVLSGLIGSCIQLILGSKSYSWLITHAAIGAILAPALFFLILTGEMLQESDKGGAVAKIVMLSIPGLPIACVGGVIIGGLWGIIITGVARIFDRILSMVTGLKL